MLFWGWGLFFANVGLIFQRSFCLIFLFLELLNRYYRVCVVADSHRSVFYRHQVLGQYGKSFTLFKFRTMVADSHQMPNDDSQLARNIAPTWRSVTTPELPALGEHLESSASMSCRNSGTYSRTIRVSWAHACWATLKRADTRVALSKSTASRPGSPGFGKPKGDTMCRSTVASSWI